MPVEADLLASTVEVIFESLAYGKSRWRFTFRHILLLRKPDLGLFTVLAVVSTIILT